MSRYLLYYMDDLSSLLNTSRIGCHIDDVCINQARVQGGGGPKAPLEIEKQKKKEGHQSKY